MFIQEIFCSVFVPFAILSSGVYLSAKSKFFALRFKNQKDAAKEMLSGGKEKISPYRALCTSLAGTLGAGNIVGSAYAVICGGPGSVFWMLLGGLFGMTVKYCEVYLAIIFKKQKNGTHYGGPMYYISELLNNRPALVYSLLGLISCFGIGNAVQAVAVRQSVEDMFPLRFKTGFLIFIFLFCAYFVFFGIEKITKLCAPTVPIMLFLYLLCAVCVIVENGEYLKDVLESVFKEATKPQKSDLFSFFLPLRYGISSSILSNEAGLGSAAIAHGCSDTKNAKAAGIFASCEIIFNTMLVGVITAIAVLCAGKGVPMQTKEAFSLSLGAFGGYTVSLSVLLFGVTSIIGWSYYGSRFVAFITKENTLLDTVYKSVFCIFIFVFLFCKISLQKVLYFSDLACGAMASINVYALLRIYKKGKIKFE